MSRSDTFAARRQLISITLTQSLFDFVAELDRWGGPFLWRLSCIPKYNMQNKTGVSTSLGYNGVECDIDCAIRSDVHVLISGGDDRTRLALAHVLHQRTRRMDEPFVVLERDRMSEVREGWEFPPGGTLFIEEVGDLSPTLQTELMVFLDRRSAQSKIGRVQHSRGTRVVAATTYNLFERMAQQRFREDLFYRLNAIHVVLPEHDTLDVLPG